MAHRCRSNVRPFTSLPKNDLVRVSSIVFIFLSHGFEFVFDCVLWLSFCIRLFWSNPKEKLRDLKYKDQRTQERGPLLSIHLRSKFLNESCTNFFWKVNGASTCWEVFLCWFHSESQSWKYFIKELNNIKSIVFNLEPTFFYKIFTLILII